jgi:hypothetical protein
MTESQAGWMTEERVVLASVRALEAFAERIRPFWSDGPHKVELQLPLLDPVEQVRWGKRIERHAFACGCFAAAGCALLTVGYCVLVGQGLLAGPDLSGWMGILKAAGMVILAGLTGKLVAIAIARMLAKRDIQRLLVVLGRNQRLN